MSKLLASSIIFNIGTFSSMNPEQKKASLKKRSKEHFNKHLKEERSYKWKTNYGLK